VGSRLQGFSKADYWCVGAATCHCDGRTNAHTHIHTLQRMELTRRRADAFYFAHSALFASVDHTRRLVNGQNWFCESWISTICKRGRTRADAIFPDWDGKMGPLPTPQCGNFLMMCKLCTFAQHFPATDLSLLLWKIDWKDLLPGSYVSEINN
jgi:hypothetical protein